MIGQTKTKLLFTDTFMSPTRITHFPSSHNRASSVLKAIQTWNASLSPEFRDEKFARMARSPLDFYQGTNHLFWHDMGEDWRIHRFGGEKTLAWIVGDAHVMNMRASINEEGELVYASHRFDDAIIADYQYDLWRMAISIVLVAQKGSGYARSKQKAALRTFVDSYADAMAVFAENKRETRHYFTRQTTDGKLRKFLNRIQTKNIRGELINKWTYETEGKRQLNLEHSKLNPVSDLKRREIITAIAPYLETLENELPLAPTASFSVLDVAKGEHDAVSAMGDPRFFLLVRWGDETSEHLRLLDVKRQDKPTAYHYLNHQARLQYKQNFMHDAFRYVVAYRSLTKNNDDFLGWMNLTDGVFSVREYASLREPFPLYTLTKAKHLINLAAQWGRILATHHARAVLESESFLPPYAIEKQITKRIAKARKPFRRMISELAFSYAEQVQTDWETFAESIKSAA